MSDVTYATKVEGSTLSPSEVNEIKTAVNSKQNKDKLTDNFNSPDHTQYPTTQAVVEYVELAKHLMAKGTITGAENLGAGVYILPGFWTPGTWTTLHASFPAGVGKGTLLTLAHSNHVTQVFFEFAAAGAVPNQYYRTYDNDSTAWSEWAKVICTDDIDTDFSSPTGTKVPSTLAVNAALAASVLKGTIDGSEDLTTITGTGAYLPSSGFVKSHSSYPTEEKGLFLSYGNDYHVVHRYITVDTHKTFIRTWDTTAGWGNWSGVAGTPAVAVDGTGYSAALTLGDDLNGQIAITHDSGEDVETMEVTLTFGATQAEVKAAQLTPVGQLAYEAKPWINALATDSLSFQMGGAIPVGDTVTIHYSIHK